jgi:hypothetical protein
MTANERAAIGGPGLTVRTACNAVCVHPETAFTCGGCTTGVLTGVPAESLPSLPHAASAAPRVVPVPNFKKVRRFIVSLRGL